MVVNKLIVDCLLGEDNLIANEVIINYKHRCVFINGNEILFTLTQGIANTVQPATCCKTFFSETVTISGRTVYLIDVALPERIKSRNPLSTQIDLATAKLLHHLCAARTLSPVFNDCAIIQVMNISPTPVTTYQGTKIGEITPLADIHLVETQHSPSPAPTSIPVLSDIDLTESPISSTQKQQLLALLQQYSDMFATVDEPLG